MEFTQYSNVVQLKLKLNIFCSNLFRCMTSYSPLEQYPPWIQVTYLESPSLPKKFHNTQHAIQLKSKLFQCMKNVLCTAQRTISKLNSSYLLIPHQCVQIFINKLSAFTYMLIHLNFIYDKRGDFPNLFPLHFQVCLSYLCQQCTRWIWSSFWKSFNLHLMKFFESLKICKNFLESLKFAFHEVFFRKSWICI